MANTIRFKRRSGTTGAPSTLWQAEPAYNEFDHILYLGEGTGGSGGSATTIIPIAGPGGFVTRGIAGTAQTIDGLKTFTSNVAVNAANLDSTSSSFSILGTPTTINAGALATAFNIGATTGTTTVRNDLHVNGSFTIAGTTTFTGNVEVVQNLVVDSGNILTSSLTGNIFDTTATTLNIGGAATAVNIGSTSGKTYIKNANTSIAGFLSAEASARIAGNLAVNGGTVTTSASSLSLFNTNATTVTAFQNGTNINIGAVTGATKINNANTEIVGFLSVDSDARITGDLAVNGGDLTSTSSTFNIASSSTAVNIGAATGTTTVKNNLAVDGESTFSSNAEFAQDVTIQGDLTVNGNFTTINSTTVSVDDKNLELGATTTPTNATANGGGITLLAGVDGDKSIIWDSANANWTSSENWNIASGKVFKINNVDVLSSTTLGSTVVNSSLTSVGTITSGTWHGSTIAAIYGGTGISSYTKGDMLWADSGTTLAQLAIGTYDATNDVGQMLQVGPSNTVRWTNTIDGGTY